MLLDIITSSSADPLCFLQCHPTCTTHLHVCCLLCIGQARPYEEPRPSQVVIVGVPGVLCCLQPMLPPWDPLGMAGQQSGRKRATRG